MKRTIGLFLGSITGFIIGGSIGYAADQIKDSIKINRMIKNGTLEDEILAADELRQKLSIFSGNINPNPLAEQIKREQNI